MKSPGELSKAATLVELSRTRAAADPDGLAYTFLVDGETEEVRLTYAELDRRARAIAAFLQDAGAQGERVLLLYPPGLEYVSAFVGCLYAGVIAVPAYPPDPMRLARTLPRLEALVTDARARFALTNAFIHSIADTLTESSPALGALKWIATDDVERGPADGWKDPGGGRDTLAFLQYTSGSTGTPRGVMLSHGNLLHNSAAIHHGFEHSAESRGVIWLPPYHDMGLIGGVLQPLCGGFPVVLMSPLDFLRRPARWLEAISRHRATTSGGPNFAYDLCVRKTTPEQRAALDLSSWSVAFNGAEPVRPETLERFAEAFAPAGFKPRAFYPCYGLAESTLIASGGLKAAEPKVAAWDEEALRGGKAVTSSAPEGRRLIGCGASIEDQDLRIVDPESLAPSAPGQVGEIWLRGPSVARGYWERTEETALTFQARIAGSGDGPYLRTGDLGFLSGGELFVAGRIKDLIIVRGRNHHPHDLEQTAEASHPALRPGCSAAFAIEAAPGTGAGERVVLVLEVDRAKLGEPQVAIDAIRQAIADQHELAIAAVSLIAPGAMPKTSSGKVQRRACRAMYLAGELEQVAESTLAATAEPEPSTSSAPLTRAALDALPESERIAAVGAHLRPRLAAALGLAPASLDGARPLTALGLDSIQAVELKGALDEALGIDLPVSFLLGGATLDSLAAHAVTGLGASASALPPLLPRPAGSPPALSRAQERLLFLDQLASGSSAYNISAAARLEGRLDVAVLARSLAEIVRRHEVLRARFPWKDGKRSQELGDADGLDPLAAPGAIVDLTALAEPARDEEARRLTAEEARRPFDLERGPLLRTRLLVLGPERHLLLLTIHHIAADGWSMGVLVRELGALYPALLEGRPSPLPALPIQYADHAAWQRGWLTGATLDAELSWWKARLTGAPPVLELPFAKPRPAAPSFTGARHPLALTPELTQGLKRLGQAEGATPYMTLLAAFLVALHERTGRTDLVLGTDVANRDTARTQGLIGLFVNQLVLRFDLGGDPSFRALLARVKEHAIQAYAHPSVPFDQLVETLRPPRDPRHNPLFQVMFVLENAPLPALALPGLKLQLLEVDDGGSPFDLSVLLSETDGRLGGALRYSTALFDPADIARLAGDFEALLATAVAQPDVTLSALRGTLEARRQAERSARSESLRASRLDTFKTVRRAQVGGSSEAWVRFEELAPGRSLPAVARPAAQGIDLAEWASKHRALVEERLHRAGAILFRGFDVASPEGMNRVIEAVADQALPYEERSSPRSQVSGHIYTSTDHPPSEQIFQHNEQSYNLAFPLRLFFCCVQPSLEGGETPLADSRRVFARLPAEVRARFLEHGYLYVRNFGNPLGLSWQTAFQTEDKAQVEAYCDRNRISLEWRDGGRLRTKQVRRAAGLHPVTGEPVWFNHATFFHVSTLPAATGGPLLAALGEAELPNNTYYGDGAPIPASVLETLRAAYRDETVAFPWQKGDLLLIDNMLAAHGRASFVGPRRVLAGMARLARWDDIPPAPLL